MLGMDYERMKALMKAAQDASAAQGKTQGREFPKPDFKLNSKYVDQVLKERIAA